MHRTCPTNRDSPPLLAQYLEIFAGQDLAVDQVTVAVLELVAVQRLALLAVALAGPDCFSAASLAHCTDLVWGNSFVDSKAFEAYCSVLRSVTCTNCSAGFYKNEFFIEIKILLAVCQAGVISWRLTECSCIDCSIADKFVLPSNCTKAFAVRPIHCIADSCQLIAPVDWQNCYSSRLQA